MVYIFDVIDLKYSENKCILNIAINFVLFVFSTSKVFEKPEHE